MGVPNEPEFDLNVPEKLVSGKIGVVTVTFGSGDVLPDFLNLSISRLFGISC